MPRGRDGAGASFPFPFCAPRTPHLLLHCVLVPLRVLIMTTRRTPSNAVSAATEVTHALSSLLKWRISDDDSLCVFGLVHFTRASFINLFRIYGKAGSQASLTSLLARTRNPQRDRGLSALPPASGSPHLRRGPCVPRASGSPRPKDHPAWAHPGGVVRDAGRLQLCRLFHGCSQIRVKKCFSTSMTAS